MQEDNYQSRTKADLEMRPLLLSLRNGMRRGLLTQQLIDRELPFHARLLRFPVVVLVAEEASILGLADLRGLTAMARTARFDARDKNIRRFLARPRLVVAGIARDSLVGVVIERRIRQPTHRDVRGAHLRLRLVRNVLECVAELAALAPQKRFRLLGLDLHPFFG